VRDSIWRLYLGELLACGYLGRAERHYFISEQNASRHEFRHVGLHKGALLFLDWLSLILVTTVPRRFAWKVWLENIRSRWKVHFRAVGRLVFFCIFFPVASPSFESNFCSSDVVRVAILEVMLSNLDSPVPVSRCTCCFGVACFVGCVAGRRLPFIAVV
jgi:hypothetical protein